MQPRFNVENPNLSLLDGLPTPKELAASEGVTERTILRWVQQGDLVGVKVMGRMRIDLEASRAKIKGLAASQQKEAAPRRRGRPSKAK